MALAIRLSGSRTANITPIIWNRGAKSSSVGAVPDFSSCSVALTSPIRFGPMMAKAATMMAA